MSLVETNEKAISNARGPFDYTQLPTILASEARCRAKKINASKERHVLEVGRELTAMKEKLPHGQFTDWIDRELNFSSTTARNYMRVAKEFADKPATVAVLPPATLYRLAGASAELRAAIVGRVESGEYVDRVEVEDAIRRPKVIQANSERSDKASRRAAAARELVRCLSKHFTNDEILKMHAIWREAGNGALQAALETPDGQ